MVFSRAHGGVRQGGKVFKVSSAVGAGPEQALKAHKKNIGKRPNKDVMLMLQDQGMV